MYKYPADGIQNYISEPNQPLLKHLQAEVQYWDPNQYITPEVEKFCIECLVQGGFQPRELMDFSHSNNKHKLAYIYLKDEMLKFLQGGGTLPRVKLPLGGRKWIQEWQQKHQAQAWEEQEQQERLLQLEQERLLQEEVEQERDYFERIEQQAQEQLNADENEWITDVEYISEVYSDESSSTASRSDSDDDEVGDDGLELVVS